MCINTYVDLFRALHSGLAAPFVAFFPSGLRYLVSVHLLSSPVGQGEDPFFTDVFMGDKPLLFEFPEEGACAELGFHAGRGAVAAVGYGREEVLLPGLGVVEGREPHGGDAGVFLEDPQGLVLFVCEHGSGF